MIYIVKRGKAHSGAPGSGTGSHFYDKVQALDYAKAKAIKERKIIRVYQVSDRGGTPTLLKAINWRTANSNPSIKKGKWLKAKAVKFNKNGSISIKK